MVRTYLDRPLDAAMVERILDTSRRAPSAGFSQGVEFLLFEGPDQVARFWTAVSQEPGWPDEGLRAAPVIVVPLGSKMAYLDRYAEEDKGWADRDEARWPAPYWLIDAAFASMIMLLGTVDEGLGALFFGLYPPTLSAFKAEFGVPQEWEPIGAIAIGHGAQTDPVR